MSGLSRENTDKCIKRLHLSLKLKRLKKKLKISNLLSKKIQGVIETDKINSFK